jgi:hypothetical protein
MYLARLSEHRMSVVCDRICLSLSLVCPWLPSPVLCCTRMAWPFLCNPMAVTECIDSLLVLFSLVAALQQEPDVLKSTCYPSKYRACPLLLPGACALPHSPASLLFIKFCFLFTQNENRGPLFLYPSPQWPSWK